MFEGTVECVILNACYSEIQAIAIAKHIPYVIGMKTKIGDTALLEFATAFYDGLGAGKTIEFAFEMGRNAIQIAGYVSSETPVLIKGPEYVKQQSDLSDNQEKTTALTLTVHMGYFMHNNLQCYFINATNVSEKDIEITHIWFDCEQQIHVYQPSRVLPKRLKPAETWETWIEIVKQPKWVHTNPYNLARERLSTGTVVRSARNKNVPDEGFVPGGPIY